MLKLFLYFLSLLLYSYFFLFYLLIYDTLMKYRTMKHTLRRKTSGWHVMLLLRSKFVSGYVDLSINNIFINISIMSLYFLLLAFTKCG